MRILSLSTLHPSIAKPGFGRFVARQMEAFAALDGVDLVMVNPIAIAPAPFARWLNTAAERAMPALDLSRGYPVHHPRFSYLPKLGPRWNAALIARAVLPLARALHAEKPFNLVDAQFFFPDGPAAAQLARALGLPLSIKARGSDIHHWGHVPFAQRQMREAASQAAGMLSVSDALRRDMAALGMDAGKITLHYTGLDHAQFCPGSPPAARARLAQDGGIGLPADGRLIVTTGNLIPLKGQALVIEALASLPQDVRLLLAGSGPDADALRALAQRLGVADRVHMPGGIPPAAVADALRAASAMVLPSQNEGLANAWIEALACGAPLVITEVGGAAEVVQGPDAGRLVARNADAIAAAVRDLLDAPPAPAAVAAHAERFSWKANATQLHAHYARIISATK